MRAATLYPASPSRETSKRVATTFACLLVASDGERGATRLDATEALRARCARLTDRVEWLGQRDDAEPRGALLDLGRCPVDEARELCDRLQTWLAEHQLTARTGIGPTLAIAQLAALATPPGTTRAIALEQAAAFTQGTPVELLARLEPRGTITPEVVARLRRFGLRTLGQVARLDTRDPQALRRQFGVSAGAALAILAQGHDLRPLQPTPAPAHVVARLRFPSGASVDEALAALPRLAARLAQGLAAREQHGHALRLRVVWDAGGVTRARRRLARPLHQPDELAQAARGLLAPLLTPPDGAEPARLVAALTLELGDLSTRLPAQPAPLFALPSTPTERRERERLERIAAEVAEPLARRYGAPAIYQLGHSQPDAILPEDRARLVSFTPRTPAQPPETARRRGRHTSRSGGAAEAAGALDILPPQPHWW